MEIKNLIDKKIKRNKFFMALGLGAGSYMLTRSLMYKIFSKSFTDKKSISESKIKVRINSSAVSRTKPGVKNGRG